MVPTRFAAALCGALLLTSSASSFAAPSTAQTSETASAPGEIRMRVQIPAKVPAAPALQSHTADNALASAELIELRQAVRSGSAQRVKDLLNKGWSPNFRMENGDTGFTYAVRAETYDVAFTLLNAKGFKINELNKFGETPLMLAVFKGEKDLFEELLSRGADPKLGGNWTALHYAATEGRLYFVERLLEAGVSPNVQTSSGVTPLIMAARKPSRQVVRELLRAGAYRDYCTDAGQSPADYARRAGDDELAKYLAIPKCAIRGPVHSILNQGKNGGAQ